jgi:hypothetical protein
VQLPRTRQVPGRQPLFYRVTAFLQSHRRYLGLIYPTPYHHHDASAHQDGVADKTPAGKIHMFSNTTFALAFVVATACSALAETKAHSIAASQDGYTVYNPAGADVGTDPGLKIRFEVNRG